MELQILRRSRYRWYLIDNVDDDDNDVDNKDNDDIDDKEDYSCNSVNFKVMTARFYMELDLVYI